MDFNYQKSIKDFDKNYPNRYVFDFYIPKYNTIIEYNGRQHYEPVMFGNLSLEEAKENFKKQKTRDRHIKKFCKDNNINLLIIDGRKFKKEKIKDFIISKLLFLRKL